MGAAGQGAGVTAAVPTAVCTSLLSPVTLCFLLHPSAHMCFFGRLQSSQQRALETVNFGRQATKNSDYERVFRNKRRTREKAAAWKA